MKTKNEKRNLRMILPTRCPSLARWLAVCLGRQGLLIFVRLLGVGECGEDIDGGAAAWWWPKKTQRLPPYFFVDTEC
jgi:hypothetical protein